MEAELRLLLLSAGSLVAHNVVDALGARRRRCILIGANSVAEAAGNFRCDAAYLVPPAAAGAAYIERLGELIRDERPDLVIPCRDDDVLALAMLGERSPHAQPALLTGSVAAAHIMNDKLETARFAARHGLPFAPTARTAREAIDLAATYPLPLIGKPRRGNASRGVVLLRSSEEIKRAFESRPDLIAQPFLDPPADMDALIAPFEAGLPFFFSLPASAQHTVQVIVGPRGAISRPSGWLATFAGGHAVENRRCEAPELLEAGRAYALAAAAEGWKGPLNVQLKRTPEGGLVAFEVNGRFSGGTAAAAHMGFDDIGECIARFLPGTAFPPLSTSESDGVQKYLRSWPVPRRGVAALQASGTWRRE